MFTNSKPPSKKEDPVEEVPSDNKPNLRQVIDESKKEDQGRTVTYS
jgi:hypothetical protein